MSTYQYYMAFLHECCSWYNIYENLPLCNFFYLKKKEEEEILIRKNLKLLGIPSTEANTIKSK